MNKLKLILIVILTTAGFSLAQDYKNDPGYVDFGNLKQFETGNGVTEVLIEQDLLEMVSDLTADEDPALSELLKNLKLVKVNVYEAKGSYYDIQKKITDLDSKLTSSSWKRIVRRKSDEETANVYLKYNDSKKIEGLVVTAMDEDGEASFVNIVGNIDLKAIGKLSKKFDLDIPSLSDTKEGD